MKVSSLIKRLKKLEQDKDILVSCDEEGNNIFNNVDIALYGKDYCIFPQENTRIGEEDLSSLSDEELNERIANLK